MVSIGHGLYREKKTRYIIIYYINAKQHEKYNVNDKEQIPEQPLDIYYYVRIRETHTHTTRIYVYNV